MSDFDRLHPALRHHIVNTLGWSTLRPTQLAAIAPIHAGTHCLLLAPTSGGKTEAAVFPLLCCGVHTALHCSEARAGLPAGSERRRRQ